VKCSGGGCFGFGLFKYMFFPSLLCMESYLRRNDVVLKYCFERVKWCLVFFDVCVRGRSGISRYFIGNIADNPFKRPKEEGCNYVVIECLIVYILSCFCVWIPVCRGKGLSFVLVRHRKAKMYDAFWLLTL